MRSALAALLLSACVHDEVFGESWWADEGRSFPDAPHLFGEGGPFVADLSSRLSLVTWPELTEVPSTVAVQMVEVDGPPVAWLDPATPLSDRWYAIRWAGEVSASVVRSGAIPLADGSVVWRFHGTFVPEIVEVHPSDGQLWFTGILRTRRDTGWHEDATLVVPPCAAPAPAILVEQDGERWSIDCGPAELVEPLLDTPGFDAARPFHLVVRPDSVATREGRFYAPVDQVITRFPYVLAPARNPPPVPRALCAGVMCE